MRSVCAFLIFITACAKSPRSAPTPEAHEAPRTALNPAGLGFYPLGPGVPAKINAAADSVFLLITIGPPEDATAARIDVSGGKGQTFKSQIIASDDDEVGKTVAIKQIERCEALTVAEQKSCAYSYRFHQATGFVAGDGRTLWTNAHVVEHSLKYIERLEKIPVAEQLARRGRVDVYVFSRDGRLLVNPNTDPIRLKVIPPFSKDAGSALYAADSDYVALALPRDIGPPLTLAKRTDSRARLYVLGYPLCTNCPVPPGESDAIDFSDRSPRPNSDGKSLRVSSGIPVSLADVLAFADETIDSTNSLDIARVLFTNADAQLGNSGGPVLNERGEVVAIHAGGSGKMIDGRHENVSRAVIPKEFLN